MIRTIKTTAVVGLCLAVGVGLVGCEETPTAEANTKASASTAGKADKDLVTGTKKIKVDGHSVNVSCTGTLADGKPVVVLVAGLGDGLDKLAKFQKTLSEKNRVCSYDRLGEGKSDKPDAPQTIDSTGKILTGVLDQVAGDHPVVLAGHSLGGLIAARYAPDHQDKVKGLVLMDATSSTTVADIEKAIPKSATGQAAQLRAQTIAVAQGQNPEKISFPDGKVKSAGSIPTEVIQHGTDYLSSVPTYGAALQQAWADGQRKWLAVSSASKPSTATKSGHYIYVEQAAIAVKAVTTVTGQVAD